PHQLALGAHQLVVDTAQHVAERARVVVLHEISVDSGCLAKILRIEAFEEKAARVLQHLRFEDQHAVQGGRLDFHESSKKARITPSAATADRSATVADSRRSRW